MNVQLHKVISDITGTTGMAIIAGERDPKILAAKRHQRTKNFATSDAITRAKTKPRSKVFNSWESTRV